LAEQINFTAFARAFTSLTRNAFITFWRQRRSCAVAAIALEAVTANTATAARTKIEINFKTGEGTLIWVFLSFSGEIAGGAA